MFPVQIRIADENVVKLEAEAVAFAQAFDGCLLTASATEAAA